MSMNTLSIRRALLATGVAVSLGLSQTALADTATDELEITAGLTEALTLSCDTALSFGITRLGDLDRGGSNETTITVAAADGSISVGGTDTGVTAGSGQAGECNISGSSAAQNADVMVQIGGEDVGNASTTLNGDNDAFSGLGEPTPALSLGVAGFELDPVTPQIDGNGAATFNIGATLTIPGTVIEANLGGYSNEVTISVDDGFGD